MDETPQIPQTITREWLRDHPEYVFVFGDNMLRTGRGGAAALRDEPNTLGFVTKRAPNNEDWAFYKPEEYIYIYRLEVRKVVNLARVRPGITFLISRVGAGLANRFGIFESVVQPNLKRDLAGLDNVVFLW